MSNDTASRPCRFNRGIVGGHFGGFGSGSGSIGIFTSLSGILTGPNLPVDGGAGPGGGGNSVAGTGVGPGDGGDGADEGFSILFSILLMGYGVLN